MPLKIRLAKKQGGEVVYSLTVPRAIAEMVPESKRFKCSVTDDGILFRPVEDTSQSPAGIPAWVESGATVNEVGETESGE